MCEWGRVSLLVFPFSCGARGECSTGGRARGRPSLEWPRRAQQVPCAHSSADAFRSLARSPPLMNWKHFIIWVLSAFLCSSRAYLTGRRTFAQNEAPLLLPISPLKQIQQVLFKVFYCNEENLRTKAKIRKHNEQIAPTFCLLKLQLAVSPPLARHWQRNKANLTA